MQSMKFEILSFVLLLLILFMFCHFVRLSALSFTIFLSLSLQFNNIYNITKGKRALPWSGGMFVLSWRESGNICAF